MTINIANDFSIKPLGRYYTDGQSSGERFREEFLVPAFRNSDKVTVIFDGVEGFGSSFLEEAFGGLVRVHHFAKTELERLDLISLEDESLIDEVQGYINEQLAARH